MTHSASVWFRRFWYNGMRAERELRRMMLNGSRRVLVIAKLFELHLSFVFLKAVGIKLLSEDQTWMPVRSNRRSFS